MAVCEYGYEHPTPRISDDIERINYFSCHVASHARAAVFGNPPPMDMTPAGPKTATTSDARKRLAEAELARQTREGWADKVRDWPALDEALDAQKRERVAVDELMGQGVTAEGPIGWLNSTGRIWRMHLADESHIIRGDE